MEYFTKRYEINLAKIDQGFRHLFMREICVEITVKMEKDADPG
jgi:hypothetical protein